MKNLKKYLFLSVALSTLMSCSSDGDNPVANDITLHFNNTFKNEPIVLGDATSSNATENTSVEGQIHRFSELKYVISNIRLVKTDGTETPYNINDLDNGATVINQAKPQTLDYVLRNIPAGEYKQLKFGLGVKHQLNTLDQVRFPNFYAEADENDTEMMWEWGTGYRFTKIEGFYDTDHTELSIHTGSTIEGEEGAYTQGVDAYRDIALDLPVHIIVGTSAPKITIKADFDKLLSGKSNTIILVADDNATTPSYHSGMGNMIDFVDNLGGDGASDFSGMFSIERVDN